jgi:hypothetical protein
MVNKINKEKQRSMNATATGSSNKAQRPGGPQTKQDTKQNMDRIITL